MQLLVGLLQIPADALVTGLGFSIPDVPQVDTQGREKSLRDLLPSPRIGKVALVSSETGKSRRLSFENAEQFLKDVERSGQPVWIVVSDE